MKQELLKIPENNELLGMLPVGTPAEVSKFYRGMIPDIDLFRSHLEQARLYRYNLAAGLEDAFAKTLNHNRRIICSIAGLVTQIVSDSERRINDAGEIVRQQQAHIAKISDQLDRLKSVREVEQGEVEMLSVQKEELERQLEQFYGIVQKDVDRQIEMLGSWRPTLQKEQEEMFLASEGIALALEEIRSQQDTRHQTLKSMNNLIKAMVHNTKNDAFTQVEEGELQFQAIDLLLGAQKKVSLEQADDAAMNMNRHVDKELKEKTILQQMEIKERDIAPQVVNLKKAEKQWCLPPPLVVFIENMSKENENGRVLPWQHVKKTINQIYSDRIKQSNAQTASLVSSRVSFPYFFVLYYLKQFKMRRLAELKCLEMLISIKYYSKYWAKADMLAALLQIFKFKPTFQISDTNNFQFDAYAEHFFFHLYERLSLDPQHCEDEQGSSLITVRRVKILARRLLHFVDDLSRTRLLSKIEKTTKIRNRKQYVDFDVTMQIFFQQYYWYRRRNQNHLSKGFGKICQASGGFCSLKDIESLLKELDPLNRADLTEDLKHLTYPSHSSMQVSKLYMYAITSGKNKFDINPKDFIKSCTRFGFDSPFPCLQVNPARQPFRYQDQQGDIGEPVPASVRVEEKQETKGPAEMGLAKQPLSRVDTAVFMFSQHFAILKELKDQTNAFRATMRNEVDGRLLWGHFQRIIKVVEKGCKFLSYPLLI